MATISNNEIKIKYSLDTTDLANATALFDRLSAEDRQLLNDLKKLQAQLTATGQAGQAAGNNIGGGNRAASGSINDLTEKVRKLQSQLNNMNPTANNYQAVLDRLKKAKDNLKVATDNLNAGLGKTNGQLKESAKSFDLMSASIKQVGAYIGTYLSIQAIVSFTKQILTVTKNFESLQKAIEFTSGTMTQGMKNFEFLRDLAEQLGLPLQTAAEAFKSFSAAAQRANMTMEQQQSMFTDLAKAMSALQVTATDAQLIFYGLSQMMSKPKVQTQELVLQIGEKLPIAMQAATIALARMQGVTSVTTGELMKMVSEGKILSEKFVPEFTKALGELAGDSAYVETLGKGLTRLSNAWDEMLLAMGESRKGFIKDTVDGLTEMFNSIASLFPESKAKKLQIFSYDMEKENIKQLSEAGKAYTKEQLEQIIGNLETTKNAEAEKLRIIESGLEKGRKAAMKGIGGKIGFSLAETLGLIPDEMKSAIETQDQLTLSIADTQGKIDAYTEALKNLLKVKKEDSTANDGALNEYKRLIADLEASKIAEDNYIKARTREGYTRDKELLQNNINFNNQMLKIDEDARFKNLDLAKNNAKKRKGENERDAQEIINTRQKALDEANEIERKYIEKNLEDLKEAALKRKQARQTELQNELQEIKSSQDKKLTTMAIEMNKAISVQELSEEKRLEIIKNYTDQEVLVRKNSLNAQLAAIRDFYAKEKVLNEENKAETDKIYANAATMRMAALAKTEQQREDILDQGALAEITIEKNRLVNQKKRLDASIGLSQDYVERETSLILAKLEELKAKEFDIEIAAERRKQQAKLEIVEAGAQALSQISNDLTNLYLSNLDREKEALNQKYQSDVRLAGDNKQKLVELEQNKARAEYEIELKQFRARQLMAVAEVIFKTAPEIAKWIATGVLAPVAAIGLAAQFAAIGTIMSQPPPVPPYKDGTKGRPHPGGPAIVGEAGTEKVVTTDGQVYYTPPTATLIDLPRGAQVIPNHALSKKELFWANALNDGKPIPTSTGIERRLDKIGGILEALPVHQINMNEKGFEKFVRTPRRTTKILNNQFPIKH